MEAYAEKLHDAGWTLRSGHAQGADQAFERGAGEKKEIFLPKDNTIPDEAYELAKSVHPRWDLCSAYARACHARNTMQILGRTLKEPVAFVLCWTPDGAESEEDTSIKTGGTATAIRLASRLNIRVFNLQQPNTRDRFEGLFF